MWITFICWISWSAGLGKGVDFFLKSHPSHRLVEISSFSLRTGGLEISALLRECRMLWMMVELDEWLF